MKSHILWIGLAALIAPTLAVAETWSLPLTIESASGCQHDLRRAELLEKVPTTDQQGTVSIDATQPTRWSGQADSPPVEDELLLAGYASYDILVPEAGQYTLWVQFAAPRGRTQFVEMVNGRRITAPFREMNPDNPAPLKWVRRFRTALKPGLNRIAIADHGLPFSVGPQLRRLALARDDDARLEGDGPATVMAPVERATVETASVRVPGLRRVVAVTGVPDGVQVEYRLDEADWKSMPAAGVEATGSFRLRFTLTPASRALGPIGVDVETEEGALVSLRSGDSELLFDRTSGGLFLARNVATGTVYSGGAQPQTLSAIDFKRRGEAIWTRVDSAGASRLIPKEQHSQGPWDLQVANTEPNPTMPDAIELSDGALTIRRTYAAEGLGRALVTETVAPDGDGDGVWRMAAQVEVLEGPADVVALMFPQIDRVTIGDSGLDDEQLRLQSYGDQFTQPGRQRLRDELYSGAIVMNWTQVFDEAGSVYLGVHDPRGTTTRHGSVSSGPEGEAVSVFTQRLDDIRPGETAVWDTRLALSGGSWHRGADLYRDWFTETHGTATYPNWLRTTDGWLNLQLENMPGFKFEQLPRHLTVARALGFDWVQTWGQFGYDNGGPCCSAWYGPSPHFGGAEALKQAAGEIRERGGFLGGYFHYNTMDELPAWFDLFLGRFHKDEYAADLPWDQPEEIHRLRVVTDPANSVPAREPGEAELAEWQKKIDEHQQKQARGERASAVQWWTQAWIPDPAWRERMVNWVVDRYVGQWNCNAAYIDVLGTGRAVLSYDPRRGHNGDGGWGEGRLLVARALSEQAREKNPDFVLAQEGMGDQPGLYAANLHSGVYLGGRNVMRYTFPDRVLIHGMSNAGDGTSRMDRWLWTFSEAMRFDIIRSPDPLAASLLTLMRSFTPELWQARFLDTVGVDADRRLIVRRLECQDNSLRGNLLTVVNRERVDGARVTIDETVAGRVAAAFSVEMDGTARALNLERNGESVSFEATESLASVVYLAAAQDQPTSSQPVWPTLRVRRERPPAVEVTLFNLSQQRQRGVCRLDISGLTEPYEQRVTEARAMLPLTTDRLSYDLPPLASQTLSFPLQGVDRLQWSVPVGVTLEPQVGRPLTRYVLVTPLVLDGSFDFLDGEETAGAEGGHALRLPPSEEYQYTRKDLWLLPQRRYRLSLRARRTGFQASVSGALVRLSREEGEDLDAWLRLDRQRPNEWQTLVTEFTTPSQMTGAQVFLYNVRSPDTAWFDEIVLEDLGPAPDTQEE